MEELIDSLQNHELCLHEEEEARKKEFEALIKSVNEKEAYNRELEEKLIEKEENLSDRLNESITKISKELEEKLKEVKNKEKELEVIRQDLEEKKIENEKVAMMLKVTHLEMENNRIKACEKMRVKKEKLKGMKAKLEEHLKFVQMKDQEKSPRVSV